MTGVQTCALPIYQVDPEAGARIQRTRVQRQRLQLQLRLGRLAAGKLLEARQARIEIRVCTGRPGNGERERRPQAASTRTAAYARCQRVTIIRATEAET